MHPPSQSDENTGVFFGGEGKGYCLVNEKPEQEVTTGVRRSKKKKKADTQVSSNHIYIKQESGPPLFRAKGIFGVYALNAPHACNPAVCLSFFLSFQTGRNIGWKKCTCEELSRKHGWGSRPFALKTQLQS